MSLFFAEGSEDAVISEHDLDAAIKGILTRLGPRSRALILPPDFTRFHSQAGRITRLVVNELGSAVTDIMPALGTHDPMENWQIDKMFPGVDKSLFRPHRWREDVVTVGEVPADVVSQATEGLWNRPWPAQVNKLLRDGGHDLILSVGQVVPHEVIGMANFNKNIFVGTGGSQGINESHFIGAAYGMERMMGRADTPLRRILNYASEQFCRHLPIVYLLTVVDTDENGQVVLRGLFAGDDAECFHKACQLSQRVNFTILSEEPSKIVAYLDPEEFHSTWLGNKSVYRTRMLMADQGELIVLAPAVRTFGEDKDIDRLIRKYGYRRSEQVMRFVEENDDLQNNLSAAAHLIHGSSEDRFTITYCPGKLTRDEIQSVGYEYADLNEMMAKYPPERLKDGWNDVEGERIYFVRNPALGLWASEHRFSSNH